jgi:hypothetical protein
VKHWIFRGFLHGFLAPARLRLAFEANTRPHHGSDLALSQWPALPTGIFTVIEDQRDAFGCLTPPDPLVPDPSPFEVEIAIVKLKSYKSPGSDQIPAELIEAGGETLWSEMRKLMNSIYHKDQWKESIIVPVLKKGDKPDCSNYRGISLLSTSYRILPIVLFSRLSPCICEITGDHQCGFQRNGSTTDQIFCIRQIR